MHKTMSQTVHLGKDYSVLLQDTDQFSFVFPQKDDPLMFTGDQKWTIALL